MNKSIKQEISNETVEMLSRALYHMAKDEVEAQTKINEAVVKGIIKDRFGVETDEEIQRVIDQKKLSAVHKNGFVFGVIANNRWLYTIDGKAIGKKGKHFNI